VPWNNTKHTLHPNLPFLSRWRKGRWDAWHRRREITWSAMVAFLMVICTGFCCHCFHEPFMLNVTCIFPIPVTSNIVLLPNTVGELCLNIYAMLHIWLLFLSSSHAFAGVQLFKWTIKKRASKKIRQTYFDALNDAWCLMVMRR
jgi:hypothetical protein